MVEVGLSENGGSKSITDKICFLGESPGGPVLPVAARRLRTSKYIMMQWGIGKILGLGSLKEVGLRREGACAASHSLAPTHTHGPLTSQPLPHVTFAQFCRVTTSLF